MTRDQFIYALTACGCLLKDDKTWYEHNELIKCLENLGLFEEESTYTSQIAQKAYEDGKKDGYVQAKLEQEPILDKIRAEILEEHENAYAREDNDTAYGLSVALDILDKYRGESEVDNGNDD